MGDAAAASDSQLPRRAQARHPGPDRSNVSVANDHGEPKCHAPAMSGTKVSRRSRGEDATYFAAAKNRYVGSVSLGYAPDGKRIRRKVLDKTK
jgi:hypothetical protein